MNIEIREYKDSDLDSLNIVLKEVYNIEKKGQKNNNNIELVAIYKENVVGYLVINKLYDNIKNINYAHINYVCVLKKYQNNKIGYNLLKKSIEISKTNNISYIELTSNKQRLIAHHLYEKIGFQIRDTNVFRKELI